MKIGTMDDVNRGYGQVGQIHWRKHAMEGFKRCLPDKNFQKRT